MNAATMATVRPRVDDATRPQRERIVAHESWARVRRKLYEDLEPGIDRLEFTQPHSTFVRLPTPAPRLRLCLSCVSDLYQRADKRFTNRPAGGTENSLHTRTVSQPHRSSRESDACRNTHTARHPAHESDVPSTSYRIVFRYTKMLVARRQQRWMYEATTHRVRRSVANGVLYEVGSWSTDALLRARYIPVLRMSCCITPPRIYPLPPVPCARAARSVGVNCRVAAHLMLCWIARAAACKRLPAAFEARGGPAVRDRRTRVARHDTLRACDLDALSKVISSRPMQVREMARPPHRTRTLRGTEGRVRCGVVRARSV
ncbi:hypothetical protein MSAN_01345700 [Mycena sanguinolenta]|uniref:Uncharacterized protein n=1 Tax=Mycena sanguinolenta TaxID=230812 RepID=A0A8H6YAM3_9AGAR|nr:hypothetical protein MSAN_01345700 [Mycena sanguinolenta]